jgi:hypothetical protein
MMWGGRQNKLPTIWDSHFRCWTLFSSHITFKDLILMEQRVISPPFSIFHSETGIYEFEFHIFLAVYPSSRWYLLTSICFLYPRFIRNLWNGRFWFIWVIHEIYAHTVSRLWIYVVSVEFDWFNNHIWSSVLAKPAHDVHFLVKKTYNVKASHWY